jgi:hypothetical protein
MLYPLPPTPTFKQVEHLPGENRGGWGSTGVNEYTPGTGGIRYTDKYGNSYYIPGRASVTTYIDVDGNTYEVQGGAGGSY